MRMASGGYAYGNEMNFNIFSIAYEYVIHPMIRHPCRYHHPHRFNKWIHEICLQVILFVAPPSPFLSLSVWVICSAAMHETKRLHRRWRFLITFFFVWRQNESVEMPFILFVCLGFFFWPTRWMKTKSMHSKHEIWLKLYYFDVLQKTSFFIRPATAKTTKVAEKRVNIANVSFVKHTQKPTNRIEKKNERKSHTRQTTYREQNTQNVRNNNSNNNKKRD